MQYFLGGGRDAEVERAADSASYGSKREILSQPKHVEKQDAKGGLQKTKARSVSSTHSIETKQSWWSKTIGRRKSKKNNNPQEKTKEIKSTKSTLSMRKHHHATFAHLIHDALIRLKCSQIHHSGYSKTHLVRNIERHYRLKLGERFNLRLQKSLKKLVRENNLNQLGNKRSGFRYTPRANFLKHFARLKVIGGAANRRFGLKIRRHQSRRRRRRSPSHRRRQRRRLYGSGRKRRLYNRSNQRSRRNHIQGHHSSQNNDKSHHSESSYQSKQSKDSSRRRSFGCGSLARWLWPSKTDEGEDDGEQYPQATEGVLRDYQLGHENHKRKYRDESQGKGEGHRQLKRIRIREHPAAAPPIHHTSPTTSDQGSLADASSIGTKFGNPESRDSTVDTQNPKEMNDNEVLEQVRQGEENNDDDDRTTSKSYDETITTEDEDMSEATSPSSATSSLMEKSREENETLHSPQKNSGGPWDSAPGPCSRSFLQRLRDSFRRATCSSGTVCLNSTTNQGEHSGSQNPSNIGPTSSRTSKSRRSTCRYPKFPLSPGLASLLQD